MDNLSTSSDIEPVAPQSSLADCRRQLRSHDVRVRRRAVENLAGFGLVAEPLLLRALVDTSPLVRTAALEVVKGTSDLNTQEFLLTLISISYPDIRDYAAQKLGEIGDERALVPLMAAYQRCFPGIAPRKMHLLGRYLVISYGLITLVALWMWTCGKFAVQDILLSGFIAFSMRPSGRCRGEAWRVVLEAIMKVAERSPQPELQRLLPDLQSIAIDRFQVHREAREIARSAADRIQVLTAAIHDLPVPAGAHPPGAESLPVPSAGVEKPGVVARTGLECRRG